MAVKEPHGERLLNLPAVWFSAPAPLLSLLFKLASFLGGGEGMGWSRGNKGYLKLGIFEKLIVYFRNTCLKKQPGDLLNHILRVGQRGS
jgi:hypothetical protein